MSRIGHIDFVRSGQNGERSYLKGEFVTAHHAVEFLLNKIPGERPEKAPTHEIATRGGHGKFAVIGSAWEHTIRRGENAGAVMYMLEIDDPDLPNFRLTAFPDVMGDSPDGLNRWNVETERKRKSSGGAGGFGGSSGGGVQDDEIPF